MLSTVVFTLAAIALLLSQWLAARADAEASPEGLFDRVMRTRTARIALIVCWWWIGWHVLVAQTVDPTRGG